MLESEKIYDYFENTWNVLWLKTGEWSVQRGKKKLDEALWFYCARCFGATDCIQYCLHDQAWEILDVL